MLKLYRLELSGFKSFVDPTEVRFAGGVTGIVGPNGCGKSNLSDAISWVLGEQSAKTLRGDTMEDVIFNGAEQRKPLGMADVSLTFLTDPGFPASEDGRLTISRRVFRTGESQYRLNGKVVRLKEIKDLLMDTGLGIRAYSVIEQGKIGLILSGKPQERRKLIEEAAGVTRYKARKKIAEVKLEDASANLLRLDDILAEVERNLRSLKRQAGAARRYQEKLAETKSLEREVLLGRSAALAAARTELESRAGGAESAEAAAVAEVHRREAALAARREELERIVQAAAERARRRAEVVGAIERLQEFVTGSRRTIAEIDSRRVAGDELALRRHKSLAASRGTGDELANRIATLSREHEDAAAAVEADGQALRSAAEKAGETESRLEELRRDLLSSMSELTALGNRIHRDEIEGERGEFRRRHVGDELAIRSSELGEAAAALEAAEAETTRSGEATARLEAALAEARGLLESLLVRESAASETLRSLETELAARRERRQFLGELAQAESERRTELRARLERDGIAEPRFLGDLVRPYKGWEETLDLHLGELLDALIAPAGGDGLAIARRALGGSPALRAVLVPGGAGAAPPEIDDPAIVAELGEAIGLPLDLARALPPAYLVIGAADAGRLARRYPGVAFLSRERIVAQDGVLRLGGRAAEPGSLSRVSELAALSPRIAVLESDLVSTRQELAAVVALRSEAAERSNGLQETLSVERQKLAVARARHEETSGRHRRLALAEEALRTEGAEIERELSRLEAARQGLAHERAARERRHAELEQRFDRSQAEVEAARSEREALRAEGAGRRGRLDVLTERLRALAGDRSRIEREIEVATQESSSWASESEALAARRLDLVGGIARAESELQGSLEESATTEGALRIDEFRIDDEREGVRGDEASLAGAREDLEASRAALGELRVARAGLEHDAAYLVSEWKARFGEEPLPEPSGEAPPDLSDRETRLAELRAALEALGPVNVLAAAEYTSEEERHTFLSAQRADVAKSVESLRQTIREINQTSSARFREAFVAVNEQFGRTFQQLFRGGEAEMRLMDEEDLLECGIEIVARPPGKRLQNLMLLSGGEKALTAIALLFALFRTKPSPFCILDEVDAPLDDVNTLRFVGMLRELAGETQCIVITHNKLTMEVASTLYGVTMEERGVSKLVQVELEEVQPAVAATA